MLIVVLILMIFHMAIEIVGGIVSGSLGLLAHASHDVVDVVAIGLALFAMWMAERPATITRTFGYQRIEVLVVMVNALVLWVLANWIIFGAYQRLVSLDHDHELAAGIMLIVALAGLATNLVAAWALYHSSHLRRLRRIAYEDFGVHHVTLRLETSADECAENHHVGHLEARTHAEARQTNIGIRLNVRGDENAT